jgi:hypothetical protein
MSGDTEQPGDFTRKKQTAFLSAEFLITMLVQTCVFLVLGTTVLNKVEARVTALEAQQVTDARIARLEEKMAQLLVNQGEFKVAFAELQRSLKDPAR